MKDVSPSHFDEFVTAANRIAEFKLVLCSSGNLSWRVGEDCMLATATNSWMSNLSRDQVSVCRISDGRLLAGPTPTKENGFHRGAMLHRPEVNVVLHFQSPQATAVACRRPEAVDFFLVAEIPHYIGPVGVVPFLMPGTTELAEAVSSSLKDHDLVVMRNHGQVVVGETFDQTIQKAVFFEFACGLLLAGRTPAGSLPPEAIPILRA